MSTSKDPPPYNPQGVHPLGPPPAQGQQPQWGYGQPQGGYSQPGGYGPGYDPPSQPHQYSGPNVVVVGAPAATNTIIVRRGVNHCMHFCISLFFFPWIFVWIFLCVTEE